MEYTALRGLLEDVQLELTALFEHGLTGAGHRESSLRACSERMTHYGLTQGAALTDKLCNQLAASRLDVRWEADTATGLLAQLWGYIGLCLRRLEFLEAKAALQEA